MSVFYVRLSSAVLKDRQHTYLCFLTGTVEIFLKRIYKTLPHLDTKECYHSCEGRQEFLCS